MGERDSDLTRLSTAAHSTSVPSRETPQPERIGGYRVVGEVGRGGMGVVYLAEDSKLMRRVALKLLTGVHAQDDTAALESFKREAQLLAAITHPNIATIHSLEECDGEHFLTMELVAGATLAELLVDGPLPFATSLAVCGQIAAALDATHRKQIIHQDLKPANIKVTDEGQVKVLDFGIAKMLPRGIQETRAGDSSGVFCGTPGYMSPEQLRNASVDHRADIWAFGCILFECLSGQRAFPGDTTAERIASTLEHEPGWSELPADTPAPINDLLVACLAKKPEARLGSIAHARLVLDEALEPGASDAAPGGRIRDRQAPLHNLPLLLAKFVGRGQEMRDVRRLVTENRLVTLSGAGGSGKTRLALEAAGGLLPEFPDGIWLVELAPVADPARLAQTVCAVLSLKEQPQRALSETLADYLRGKRLLLLLDNCEHLLGACTELAATLLSALPELKVLATSREALGITGETIYQVPPLMVPESESPVGDMKESEAVQLFVERARSVSSEFTLNEENGGAVAQICRRLDGIPLALELAAARARVLEVEEIARRLDDRFLLLTGGSTTSLPHHQTLRALVDWSYNQLDASEQALLRRLSIFAGGWTLGAAETICAGAMVQEADTLELHSRLVSKSLVEMDTSGDREAGKSRYRMLETLREYGRDRLAETGEIEDLRRRHLDYYVRLVEEAESHLKDFHQTSWFHRLRLEQDNLRLAFETCSQPEISPDSGLRLAGALGRYWMIRGHWNEGRALCDKQLERAGDGLLTDAHAKTLNAAGNLAFHEGDYTQSRAHHEAALDIRRRLGNRGGQAMSLNNMGEVARMLGDYRLAGDMYEQSLSIQREIGDTWGIAVSLNNLGEVAQSLGDYACARGFHEEALATWPELGDRWGLAWSLSNLGFVADKQGDLPEARAFYEKSLAISHELGDQFGVALSLHALGTLATKQQEYVHAVAYHERSLEIRAGLGDRKGVAESLEAHATLAAAGDRHEAVARLLGAADAQRELISAPATSAIREELAPLVAQARAVLGQASFDREWETGRATPLDQVIEDAGGALQPLVARSA